MPDIRIYNFHIPRTTLTNGLKKWLFQGIYEVRKGLPLWKLGISDQLLEFLGKRWFFGGSKVLYPLPYSKWGKVKKLARLYAYTHAYTWWWGEICPGSPHWFRPCVGETSTGSGSPQIAFAPTPDARFRIKPGFENSKGKVKLFSERDGRGGGAYEKEESLYTLTSWVEQKRTIWKCCENLRIFNSSQKLSPIRCPSVTPLP